MNMNLRDSPMDMQSTVRTEFQLAPHEGPRGIRPAERAWRSDSRDHTPVMAVPGSWSKQAKCLDDWKAFAGDKDPRAPQSKILCGVGTDEACPVLAACLAAAMEEEGESRPVYRAGVRGGLNPTERFVLSMTGKTCAQGHPCEEFLKVRSGGSTVLCGECERLRNKERYAANPHLSRRQRGRCDRCGLIVLRRHMVKHQRTLTCQEKATPQPAQVAGAEIEESCK